MLLVFYAVYEVLHFVFITGVGHGDLMMSLMERQQNWLRQQCMSWHLPYPSLLFEDYKGLQGQKFT